MHVITFISLVSHCIDIVGAMLDRNEDIVIGDSLRESYEALLTAIEVADRQYTAGRSGDWTDMARTVSSMVQDTATLADQAGIDIPVDADLREAIGRYRIIMRSIA
ncbi:MAG: hypothetical protein ACO395_07565 [Pontimonas sp.]